MDCSRIGDRMSDGTICAGLSPETGEPLHVAVSDAPLTLTFNEAVTYANGVELHGHRDWRLPTLTELKHLFNNRAVIGGFETAQGPKTYWSSSQNFTFETWCQSFGDGGCVLLPETASASLRLVR